MKTLLGERIFNSFDEASFQELALDIFRYQSADNPVYRSFIEGLGIDRGTIDSIERIPFLPVEFFRTQKVIAGSGQAQVVFESSSTTGAVPSRHYVTDTSLYEQSFKGAFRLFYGDPSQYLIAALLPSYTERQGSSLVYMVEKLIGISGTAGSGFYKGSHDRLLDVLSEARGRGVRVLLLGVSFALLDMAEKHPTDLSGAIVMETGGMKGRRKEITREELHGILTRSFNVETIHSEYGMTELLSQAYSGGNGIFRTPPWMKILIRDPQDPLCIYNEKGISGGINVIDLANINSCSFIATSDLGRVHEDDSFEVLGRFDNSDVRGCNLMAL